MLISLSIKWSVDDPRACQGVVLSRAVIILRSIETQPLTGRFVHYVEQSSGSNSTTMLWKHAIQWYAIASLIWCIVYYCMACFYFYSRVVAYTFCKNHTILMYSMVSISKSNLCIYHLHSKWKKLYAEIDYEKLSKSNSKVYAISKLKNG